MVVLPAFAKGFGSGSESWCEEVVVASDFCTDRQKFPRFNTTPAITAPPFLRNPHVVCDVQTGPDRCTKFGRLRCRFTASMGILQICP